MTTRRDVPEDIDELAGEYVLGTLTAAQRQEVRSRLAQEPALRAAVDRWEERLLPLAALAESVQPSPRLWTRIAATLGHDAPAPQPPAASDRPAGLWRSLAFWRGLSAAGLATAAALAALLFMRPATMSAQYLVVLVAPQSQAPGWVVQADAGHAVQLVPLGTTQVPEGRALEFWTKADSWQGPISLGLVEPGQTLRIPLGELPPLEPDQLFELTLEPATGSPVGRPTGPVQFIGRAVKVM